MTSLRLSNRWYFIVSLWVALCSCERAPRPSNSSDSSLSSPKIDSLKHADDSTRNAIDSALALEDDSVESSFQPIFGHRFAIFGDFNGDSKRDTLFEHYYSQRDKKETNKFSIITDTSIDPYDYFVAFAVNKRPLVYLTSSDSSINPFMITDTSQHDAQVFGLSLLRNEGDLDGDGADEISYVIDWADWSSCNTCFIASYKNLKWENIYSFEIRDWQLPPLPEVGTEIGPFGVQGVYMNPGKNKTNRQLENQIKSFPGFIKKIRNGVIRVKTFNREVEEITKTVTLPKKHL